MGKARSAWLARPLLVVAVAGSDAYATTVTLKATGSNGKVDLVWVVSGNLRNIQVMRDTESNPSGRQRVAILNGGERGFSDGSLTNGQPYWYWIKYTDTAGTVGDSNGASATPVDGGNGGGGTAGATCANPVRANLPLVFNGVGDQCRVTSGSISAVNSWNTDLVEINGVTYTNRWSNRLPDRIDGNYYIRYVGKFPWSHLGVNGMSGAVTMPVPTIAPAPRPGATPTPPPRPTATPPPRPAATPNPPSTATPTPPPSVCDALDKRLRASTVAVGGSVPRSDEYYPVVVVPRDDGTGTSLLAWSDPSSETVKLANLSARDGLDSRLPALSGLEVHAGLADAEGVALAIVANDPDIYSSKYCKSAATPNNNVCGKMDLVRVDANGTPQFRTTLTNKRNVDSDGAYFIWWYGHTARIASDGSRYGVYFRLAGSSPRPGAAGEVDIHAGDALKVVGMDGSLQSGGWDWGCSHSWSVRLAHDGASWVAACHGDAYPNAMRIARLDRSQGAPVEYQWLSGKDPTRRALGGLVADRSGGAWLNYIDGDSGNLVLRLAHYNSAGTVGLAPNVAVSAAEPIDGGYPFRPYMAAYDFDKLLLGWKSGGKLVLAVADAYTGALLEGPVTTSLAVDRFQDFTTAPNGDVVWGYSSGGSSVTVNRVVACKFE